MIVGYEQALAIIQERILPSNPRPPVETVDLQQALGRILAADVLADRDYPPFHRSIRDGYAVHAADASATPATLRSIGEVRAGEPFGGQIGAGQCVSIMTGAPLPAGVDAVVMLEYTEAVGGQVKVLRAVRPGENVVKQGSEALSGARVLSRGRRIGTGEVGLLAMVGQARVAVYPKPTVAILPTGDEVIPLDQQPEWFQIRNSNAVALAAQVRVAGGVPLDLGIAADRVEALRELIQQGLRSDLLLLSGGVSMGKYDLVEKVLAELGAEFYFQGVTIRPGKPLVFGCVSGRFFFGLPGNPVSTFVTFELFVRPAIGLLSGAEFGPPVFLRARLEKSVHVQLGLTAFFPARVERRANDPVVSLVGWQGSGDLVGIAAANCFVVIHPEKTNLPAGEWVDVLPKPA